ncbi:hypothetical protein BD560DRAFT_429408 [Blakeslea trispora]|nr:hypothetical protein BD560DRAFT_429408 [Blakeslea trispora]
MDALADALLEKGVSVEGVDKFCYFSVEKNGTKLISKRGMRHNMTPAEEEEDEAVEVVERVDPMVISSRKRTASGEGRAAKRPANKHLLDFQETASVEKDNATSSNQPLIVPPPNVPSKAWDNLPLECQRQMDDFLKLSMTEKISRAVMRPNSLRVLHHQIQFQEISKSSMPAILNSIIKNFTTAETHSRMMGVRKNLYAFYLAIIFQAIESSLKPIAPATVRRYLQSLTNSPIKLALKKGERLLPLMEEALLIIVFPELASSYILDTMTKSSFESFLICYKATIHGLLPKEDVGLGNVREQLAAIPQHRKFLRSVAKTVKREDVDAGSQTVQRIQ